MKIGTLVGTDEMGNRYYENNLYFYGNILTFILFVCFILFTHAYTFIFLGRNRWVEYNDKVWLNYDASQIPAEWYGWIHYKTDLLPCNVMKIVLLF